MRTRRALAALAVAVGAGVLVVAGAGAASAHAYLDSSTPPDGAVLSAAPRTVVLWFSESVQSAGTVVDVVDSAGRHTRPTSVRVRHSAPGDRPPAQVTVGLPVLPRDTYRVTWRTKSSDDLHATSGVFVFGVGATPTPVSRATAGPVPGPGEVLLRWLLFLGTGVAAGGLVLALLVGRAPAPARRRLLGPASGGGAVAALAAPALLLVQSGGPGQAVRLLTDTSYGPRWTGRELALLVLVGVAWRWRSTPAGRPTAAVVAVAGVVLGTTNALLGHSAASAASAAGAAGAVSAGWVAVDAVHLLAAMVWSGSLIVGAAALPGLWRRTGAGRAALTAFGAVAGGCVALLAVTGLLLAGDRIATVDALLTSVYGRTLLVKLGLVALAGLVGLRSHRLVRGTRGGRLTRSMAAEAGVLALVLAASATLAAAAPARGPQYRPGRQVAGSVEVSGGAADLVESVAVRPNRPGRNFVSVNVFDSRRPPPGPIGRVRLVLVSPGGGTVRLVPTRSPAGDWVVATDALSVAGRWRIGVRVDRAGAAPAATGYAWDVGGHLGGTAAVAVSSAALAPWTTGLAAGLLLVLGVLAGLRRSRRPKVPMDPASGTTAPISRPPDRLSERRATV